MLLFFIDFIITKEKELLIMNQSVLLNAVVANIIIPIVLVIGSALVVVVRTYVKKITDSMIEKNEVASLNNLTSIKNNLLAEIATIVQAAVSSNMSIAESLKSNSNGKLSDAEIAMLQDSARELVYKALPPNLTDQNGSLMQLVGGQDKLDAIISSLLEHSVIESKSKIASINSTPK